MITQLFVQHPTQTDNKDYIKAPHYDLVVQRTIEESISMSCPHRVSLKYTLQQPIHREYPVKRALSAMQYPWHQSKVRCGMCILSILSIVAYIQLCKIPASVNNVLTKGYDWPVKSEALTLVWSQATVIIGSPSSSVYSFLGNRDVSCRKHWLHVGYIDCYTVTALAWSLRDCQWGMRHGIACLTGSVK